MIGIASTKAGPAFEFANLPLQFLALAFDSACWNRSQGISVSMGYDGFKEREAFFP